MPKCTFTTAESICNAFWCICSLTLLLKKVTSVIQNVRLQDPTETFCLSLPRRGLSEQKGDKEKKNMLIPSHLWFIQSPKIVHYSFVALFIAEPFCPQVQQPKNPFHLLNAFSIVTGFSMQWAQWVYLLNSKWCISTIAQICFSNYETKQ